MTVPTGPADDEGSDGGVRARVGRVRAGITDRVLFTGKLQQSSQVYGALGVALTVLLYLFFAGQILVLAAPTNTLWVDRQEILDRVRQVDPTPPGSPGTVS